MTYSEHATRFFVANEICVSLAIASVGVGEAMPFVWHRAHGFGQEREALYFDGQLTFACGHHFACCAYPVTEVEVIDVVEKFVTHDGF